MKPIQVYLDDFDAAALKKWAQSRKTTASEVVRQAVRAIVNSQERDPFFAAAGMLSGSGDASVSFDRVLVAGEHAKSKAQQRGAGVVRGHGRVARVSRSR